MKKKRGFPDPDTVRVLSNIARKNNQAYLEYTIRKSREKTRPRGKAKKKQKVKMRAQLEIQTVRA